MKNLEENYNSLVDHLDGFKKVLDRYKDLKKKRAGLPSVFKIAG